MVPSSVGRARALPLHTAWVIPLPTNMHAVDAEMHTEDLRLAPARAHKAAANHHGSTPGRKVMTALLIAMRPMRAYVNAAGLAFGLVAV